ncbi:MAG: transporter ATP-binding protein [Frankiales bacterium]|nr:transporter ATP-binding protein [Frankiales bacterium]
MAPHPVLTLHAATLELGERRLWSELELSVEHGEFLAVLGPNGAGKTSFLKVLLGLLPLTSGAVRIEGISPRRGSSLVGYVPQQRGFDAELGARGRDLVALGVDGHRLGRPWPSRETRRRVTAAIDAVGAAGYADAPIGRLSGGEQQRLRIAQALIGDPGLLLCDEPLLSLDLNHQQAVLDLIDDRRRGHGTAVLMVTHEINPVLPLVDRILYLASGRWAIGTPDEVMTSACLSDLYGTEIDVLRVRQRIVVIGAAA